MTSASFACDIGVIVGSNRRESINRKLSDAMIRLAPPGLTFRQILIDELPMYNLDLEGARPRAVQCFTDEVARADGLLIVTPEHNRSVPAVLKNAIDWGSKPMESNVWRNKPIVISGTSPGAIGTMAAQLHLRQILAVLTAQVLAGEAYIQFKPELFDAQGDIAIDSTRQLLSDYMRRFALLVEALARRG